MTLRSRLTLAGCAALLAAGCGFRFDNPVEQCPFEGCFRFVDGGEPGRSDDAGPQDAGGDTLDPEWVAETVLLISDGVGLESFVMAPGKQTTVGFHVPGAWAWSGLYGAFRGASGWEAHRLTESWPCPTIQALESTEYPALGLHIANGVSYAEWRDGDWDVYPLFKTTESCPSEAFARGSDGSVHVALVDAGSLAYLRWDGSKTTIQVEREEIAPFANGWVSIRLDSAGRPHVLYGDANGTEVRYAARVGGTWNLQTPISGVAGSARSARFALTAGDEPVFCYSAQGPSLNAFSLRCKHLTGGAWVGEDVVVNQRALWMDLEGLSIDAQGQPHLAFRSSARLDDATTHDALVYARRLDSGWELISVDQKDLSSAGATDWINGGDLQLDESGQPWILYSTHVRGLVLVHRRDPN